VISDVSRVSDRSVIIVCEFFRKVNTLRGGSSPGRSHIANGKWRASAYICPPATTLHDYERLKNMVYNRCVGTKYCSNNYPYKVRRFDLLQYTDLNTVTLQLARNSDATARNRGAVEKCTYCVQRISGARIEAKKVAAGGAAYTIADGAIVAACEAACPTEALVFGDIDDSASRAASRKSEPHTYSLLAELNTAPRTTYLARIRNPVEALAAHDTVEKQEG
jgi:Fe-S-cluster-containing dehydrogenase component